jgi:hypothetical protein
MKAKTKIVCELQQLWSQRIPIIIYRDEEKNEKINASEGLYKKRSWCLLFLTS